MKNINPRCIPKSSHMNKNSKKGMLYLPSGSSYFCCLISSLFCLVSSGIPASFAKNLLMDSDNCEDTLECFILSFSDSTRGEGEAVVEYVLGDGVSSGNCGGLWSLPPKISSSRLKYFGVGFLTDLVWFRFWIYSKYSFLRLNNFRLAFNPASKHELLGIGCPFSSINCANLIHTLICLPALFLNIFWIVLEEYKRRNNSVQSFTSSDTTGFLQKLGECSVRRKIKKRLHLWFKKLFISIDVSSK